MSRRFRLAEAFPPGEFIREELEARGWTQNDLAEILGRPLPRVNEIITGKTGVTAETARDLAQAFGTSAEYWLNLEARYRLSKLKDSDEGIRKRARIYELAPVKDMVRRGWIKKPRSHEDLEAELNRFYGVDSLDEPPPLKIAARASVSDEDGDLTPEQKAWCRRGLQLARCLRVSRFSMSALDQAIEQLRALAAHSEEIRKVPRVLAAAGVRFVIVEHLPRTKIDGAALWPSPNSPVVLMSIRYDRIDYFWHTLLHELRHIRNRDGERFDSDLAAASHDDVEQRADSEAAATLIPPEKLGGFLARVGPRISKTRLIQFAHVVGVHPGIVAGQIHYRRGTYSQFRQMLVKVREIVTSEALTDGWGVCPEV